MFDQWEGDFENFDLAELQRPPDAQVPHIIWDCPICGTEHSTDVEPSEEGPGLWFCERGGNDDIVLVEWSARFPVDSN